MNGGTLPDLARVSELKTLVAIAAEKWGDRVGLVFDQTGERLTFGEIERESNRMAHALSRLGVKCGDRVGIMLRNQPEFPLAWLGLSKIGAAMMPMNVFYKPNDARHVVDHSGAKTIVASPEFVPLLREVCRSVLSLEQIASVDGAGYEGTQDLRELLISSSSAPTASRVLPESLVNVQYTSGTTGRPKGCMLSHHYWVQIALKHMEDTAPALNDADVMLTAQPFYYMDPQWNLVTSLASGARLVVLDRFHPSDFWERVRKHEVTFFYCLGLMPTLMLRMPPSPVDRENRVRHVSCSAIPTHLHRELEERWGAPWHETFGMTETGSDISVRPEEHDELVGSGCIGRPKRGREARVVDEENRSLPRGRTGELALRGTGMMDGYFEDSEATEEAFRGGWFHTGNLVRMDEDGLIFYVGRKKEMMRRSGENISATEVEDAIKLHPRVRLVACIPVPDDLRGEEVKACVVLSSCAGEEHPTLRELADFCSDHLAYFKVPATGSTERICPALHQSGLRSIFYATRRHIFVPALMTGLRRSGDETQVCGKERDSGDQRRVEDSGIALRPGRRLKAGGVRDGA